MNRRELVRLLAVHREAAAALERAIKADARFEWEEQGNRAVWDMPGVAQVVASVTHDRVEVVDQEAWLKWVAERYPHNVRMVPALINPEWGKTLLEGLALEPDDHAGGEHLEAFRAARETGQVIDDEGTVIPGVVYAKGGEFKTASVTVDRGLKRTLAKMAEAYAAGTAPLAFGVIGVPGGEENDGQPAEAGA